MTIASYTTEDGYTIRVFSSMYIDYGLAIRNADGSDVYYNPCCLSTECYGINDDGTEWSEEDWVECLKSEANDFIEAYVEVDQ